MSSHRASLAVLLLLALAAGGPAVAEDPPLPQVDSWRHQRPQEATPKPEPKTEPKAVTPQHTRKVVAPRPEPQPKNSAPEPQLESPPGNGGEPQFERPPGRLAQPQFEPPPTNLVAPPVGPAAINPIVQQALLTDALVRLAPQRPGVHDVYFVGFAGWGDQDVFRKEAERVRDLFDARFDTRNRSLLLVNSPKTLARYPLATLENLKATLTIIAQRLDPVEDLLVLFVTSHGEKNRGVLTRLNGRDLGLITPRRLAEALDQAGIKNRVVIISSCFAGQFMTALESDTSLVITAAAANRMSFGCTTSAEWTWFGQSYFVDALPKAGKLVPAFARAKQLIANKETAEKVQPSEPQISVGPGMERLLKELGY